ncbi:MAG: hypothetical protein JNJ54_15150 [Myxococcaceae bacterium]|nr:hypothetical protein [Myxococcaceae bacterium]
MNDLELEPLPDDVLSALSQAPVAPLPPGVVEAVLAKVQVSAGLAGGAAATASGASSASGTTSSSATGVSSSAAPAASTSAGGVVAAKGGATLLLKVLPALTLTVGVGLGIATDRLVLRPTAVTERLVVERVEVPVAAPVEEKPQPVARPTPRRPAPSPDTLGRERVLLDLARSSLASRDTARALAAVQSHESQFPSGQLVEEREALAVQILWAGGRQDEATRRLHAFSLKFPDSPLRSSLDAMMRR